MRLSSCHSKMTRLTRGSPSVSSAAGMNLVRIKGSTEPPHDFRLNIPEHRCRFASSCFYLSVSRVLEQTGVCRPVGLRCQLQLLPNRPALQERVPMPSFCAGAAEVSRKMDDRAIGRYRKLHSHRAAGTGGFDTRHGDHKVIHVGGRLWVTSMFRECPARRQRKPPVLRTLSLLHITSKHRLFPEFQPRCRESASKMPVWIVRQSQGPSTYASAPCVRIASPNT